MFVPAHNDRLMSSAARVDADVLLLDIEDSVQPAANKQVARDNILCYLADGRFRGRVLYPRVNDRENGELLCDVYQLTVEGIAGFMYPKSKKGERMVNGMKDMDIAAIPLDINDYATRYNLRLH